ncbi:MAG: LSM domain-containing protein [Candidatus Odinarchaeia archaeon]
MSGQRPLDLLGRSLDKNVLVKLKGGRGLRGKLVGFDQHMNLILDEAEEIYEGEEAEEENMEPRKLGMVIVRGDNVIIISPPPTD